MSLSEKLIVAAKNGNTKEVRKLLSKGALFTKDQFGNTALHEAAWNGNSDIVKILLTGFCFVDSINNTGFTPLHLASQNGHAKVAKTLLKWKASPTLLNQHGETALHLVAKYDHANVVSSFAAYKISLDLRGKDGDTALHIAAKLGNIDTAKAMLSAGAHPALPNDKYLRPVDYAESGNYQALAKLLHSALQKYKPKLHTSNSTSSTALRPSPISSPSSPYSPVYSLSQPEEYSLSQPVGDTSLLHAIKPRAQRAMSASAKLRPLKDPGTPVNKQKNKKSERAQKLSGSLSPTPHKYFSSQDNLDGSGLCPADQERIFRSVSPSMHHQAATVDQMLTEIETEYLGPGYKYQPSQEVQSPPNGHHPLSVSSRNSPKPAKSYLKSTRNGQTTKTPYDVLAPGSDDEYDYPTNSNSNNRSVYASNQIKVCSEHAQNLTQGRSLPPTPDSPPKTGRFKHHTYEPLLPKEDVDTYVYMAPLSDYPELLQQESVQTRSRGSSHSPRTSDSHSLLSESGSELSASGSNGGSKSGKKVAAIRDSPVEADRKHEPNQVLEPAKGILMTQSSGEPEKSQLEDYLQKELETIRQAFQIRLNQLEKRYQRQLELEKQKNILTPLPPSQNLHTTSPQHKQRRNSWHSGTFSQELELDFPEKKSSSMLNGTVPGGSDIYEHDPSLMNELPESLREDNQTVDSTKESGKQNEQEPEDCSDYEDMSGGCTIDKDSQDLVQLKVKEYRERMLQQFKEQSEAKVASIEREYKSQMKEVRQKRCNKTASEDAGHVENSIKDLESRLEVQTLV